MIYLLNNNGNRIVVRQIEEKDAEFLMELNNDLDTARYVVGTPRQVTLQEQMQWMEKIKTERNTRRFIVEHNGYAVGTIIVSNIDYSNRTANVSIKLHKTARGKGIGKQGIKEVLNYCFSDMNLFCITAHILPYNNASIALFESCGFTNEGVLRSRVIKDGKRYDLISFSLTKEEQTE